ncbi:unnamed protein product, partial [Rotaria sordida]
KEMSTLTNKEKLVEQLQAERNIERIKVSMACKDLIQFCQDHQDGDALVRGFKNIPNPYILKTPCIII